MTAERMVGGRYQLGDVLGRGGMAEVRYAVDTRLGRPVAVKQLRADLATDPTFQARFRREAQSAAGLNHPTIVAVYDTGEEVDAQSGVSIPYIVMELVKGSTLRDVLRDGRKILPERALELTQGVLDALSYSHKAGIIHRDIKPANVMLTPTGGIKVMDFGIARAVADTSATITQTAAVIGTAQYLSPEQARGETVDARSDIYSAGCLLYELLVSRPPFVGDSPVSVAYQHVREAPLPPSALDPVIGPEIDAVAMRALAKNPADRYQSAGDMKADIGRVLAGQTATAYVPRVVEPDTAPTRAAARVVPPPSRAEEEVPDEDSRPKRAGLVLLILTLAILFVGVAGFGAYRYLNPATTPVAMVTVPAVLGNTKAEADSNLRNARLSPQFKNINGKSDESLNTAVSQTPRGGTSAVVNSTVLVEVNVGPKSAEIPTGLVGLDKDEVKETLEKAGFPVVLMPAATEGLDDKKDEVLSVVPEEGTTAALADEVTVTYATGKSVVPVLTGRIRAQAESDALAAGFQVKFKTRTSTQAEGVVIEQDPDPGEKVARGTTINLTVAKAKATPPPVPPTQSEIPSPDPTTPPASPPESELTTPPGSSPSPTE